MSKTDLPKDKDKYHNMCYVNNCHHNKDKKPKPWKATGKGNKEKKVRKN